MITEEWRKFRGWEVLEFFLREEGEIHVKGLANELKISPQTANYYLKFYKKAGVLKERKQGNLLLYSLLDNVLTRQLKIFYMLDIVLPFILKFAKENKVTSLVLYGSHASGTYDKNSDIDLLIISQLKKLNLNEIKAMIRGNGYVIEERKKAVELRAKNYSRLVEIVAELQRNGINATAIEPERQFLILNSLPFLICNFSIGKILSQKIFILLRGSKLSNHSTNLSSNINIL